MAHSPSARGRPRPSWMTVIVIALATALFLLPFTVLATSQPPSLTHRSALAAGWTIETVDSQADVGKYTSIALDGDGLAHISYFDDDSNDLKYARQDPMGWNVEVADSGLVYGHTSLDLDGSDRPHVSYYGSSYYSLMYAHKDASGWTQDSVNSISREYRIGKYSAIAVDSNGYSHVSYYKEYNYRGYLMYAYQDATGWHYETVESPEGSGRYPGQYTSIALDADGYPHISYYHDSDKELKYARQDASGWHIETADTNGSVGKHSSLRLDSEGYPHISYFHSSNNDLLYVHKDGTGWHRETVESEGSVGSFTSLELDDAGHPHISYRDFGKKILKYANKDAGGWHIQAVDEAGDVGEYTSLALDSEGCPHISYYDAGNDALKYAVCEETGPTPTPTRHIRRAYLPLTVARS